MVNTFIIADTPAQCARLLDYKRLGKQRLEGAMIIDALEGRITGYVNHPITQMWKNDILALKYYTNCMIDEWIARGYNNTMAKYDLGESKEVKMPWWFTCKQVQLSYCCALLLKDPEHYSKVWTVCPQAEPYFKWGYVYPHLLKPEHEAALRSGQLLDPSLVCAPLGTGIPSQHRLPVDEVKAWISKPTHNPKTGRKISPSGTIYKDYHKAALAMKLLS